MSGDTISFQQGALAVFDGDTPDTLKKLSRFIPFRFNPETLSRQISIEQAEGQSTQTSSSGGGGEGAGEQGADADSGSLKESFSVLLRFDLAFREEHGSDMPVEYGILPEVSALEDLMYPVESPTDLPSDGGESNRARSRRPLVLFIWGERRIVPIKITGMTVNETLFNNRLYPVRAEVELSLEMLGEGDASNNTRVSSALKFTSDNRRKMSRIYLKSTFSQGSKVNLPN